MNEKKKALVVMALLTVLLMTILGVIIISLIQSSEKLDEIRKVMNSKEPKIIYLAKPTCYYCNLIEPITSSLEEEFDLEYYHINTGELSNLELEKVLKIIGIDLNTFGTPYIAVVQEGKIIGEQVGYTDENVLFNLFKEHSLIDENASLNMNYIRDLDLVFNQDEERLLLIGESGDTASDDARIILRKLAREYNFEVSYFDATNLQDSTEYDTLLNKLDIDKLPILVIVKNGNVISNITDISKLSYEKFLKENNYIK